MSAEPQYTHPVDEHHGYRLFIEWLSRSDKNLAIAAETIGVSTRTAQRWMQLRQVPRPIAVLLDQVIHGPAIQGGLWRGRGEMIRVEWKVYLRAKFGGFR